MLAVGYRGAVGRWDGKAWRADAAGGAAAEGKDLFDVALNASGNVGFAVGHGGLILRWDGKAWKRDPVGERLGEGQFSSVALSADGKIGLAVSFDYDGVPLRWDGSKWGSDTSRRPAEMRMNVLWMSPSGDKALGASEEGIYRWNGSEWTLEPSGRSLHALALTPDGKLGFTGGVFGTIHRYDGSSWIEDTQGTKEAGGGALYAMALSSDGKIGFAGGSDVFLRWDGSAWHRDAKLSDRLYNSLCLNAKGDLGFSGGETILRWDGKTWRPDSEANRIFTDNGPYSMALSDDGQTGIAVSSEGSVYLWNGMHWHRDAVATQLAQGQGPVSVSLDPTGRSGWVLGQNGFLMRYQASVAPNSTP
ncbi:WD40 repeat domain-containing protein [bacterium]|nr:MAG: WD40 repeat domain-containing protein [bacterium]